MPTKPVIPPKNPPPGPTCDDRDLTDRAAGGDPAVFGDLIRCYNDRLMRAAMARCENPEDAADVLQDTYVAALRYLPGFRGEATIRGWLFRLAMSACTKKRRGRKNDPRLHVRVDPAPGDDEDRGVQLTAAEHVDPEREAVVSEAVERMGDWLLELSDLDRAILLLVDGEGRKPGEVAPMLEMTVGAVKSRLHRARKAVRGHAEELDM